VGEFLSADVEGRRRWLRKRRAKGAGSALTNGDRFRARTPARRGNSAAGDHEPFGFARATSNTARARAILDALRRSLVQAAGWFE